jgi:hypothetical protein
MKCAHGVASFLCVQFLSLESMYQIIDVNVMTDSDKNENAIINIFEEFIGCAVSTSLIASSFM